MPGPEQPGPRAGCETLGPREGLETLDAREELVLSSQHPVSIGVPLYRQGN